MKEKKIIRKQISIEIDPDRHKQIKQAATKRGLTITAYVLIALGEELRRDLHREKDKNGII